MSGTVLLSGSIATEREAVKVRKPIGMTSVVIKWEYLAAEPRDNVPWGPLRLGRASCRVWDRAAEFQRGLREAGVSSGVVTLKT